MSLAFWFRRSQANREMDDELRSHIQLRADDLERSGLTRSAAERKARIEFGGYEKFKEESREAAGGHFFEVLVQDLRFASRVLRKSPGFTITAVLTLALAIGANAVVFGIMNALIIRPLNVPQAQSLYGIERGSDKAVNQSYPDYLDLRDRNRSFEDLAAYNVAGVTLDTGNHPSGAWIMETTGNYFDALGIQPYLGRFFHGTDEHGPNSAPYIVLTHAYWHAHFQNDRGVVGRVVQVNKHPFTILGVAPPEFRGTVLFVFPDFWVPIVNQEQVEGTNFLNARGTRGILMVLGHLKAGVTPAQATADLNSIGAYLEKTYPQDDGHMNFTLTRPSLTGDWLGGPIKAFLTGLMLLAGLILLAACANLGSLFAARAADRSREVAVRLALGSSPARILRQLFTEAVLISLIGGGHRPLGQRPIAARLERVATASHGAAQCCCVSRRTRLRRSIAVEFGERIPLRRSPRKAGASHRSLRDHQVGSNAHDRAKDQPARPLAGRANRDLCGAGDFFSGCCPWTDALAAQQFRL